MAMKIHPAAKALSKWLTVLSAKEARELKADIQKNGVQVPILVTKSQDTIIDGRNRWMAAHELGIPANKIPLEPYTGEEKDIPGVILSRNIFRRHLSDDQRLAVLTHVLTPELEKEAKARRTRKGKSFDGAPKDKGSVATKLAEKAGTTRHRAEQALRARRAGTLRRVMSGQRSLGGAAKDAGPKKTRVKKTPPSLEKLVWRAFQVLLRKFTHDEQREVKRHLRNFLGGAEPKSA